MRITRLACLAFGVQLAAASLSATAAEPVAPLVREHFIGLDAVLSRPDLAPIRAILTLPESQRLLSEITTKLATHLPLAFRPDSEPSTNAVAALKPALRSLLQAESIAEVHGSSEGVSSWAVAARLDPARTRLVVRELARWLPSIVGGSEPSLDTPAWELPEPGEKALARCLTTNGWIVLGHGDHAFNSLRDRVTLSEPPLPDPGTNDFLHVEADLKSLASLLDWGEAPPGPLDQWPDLTLDLTPRQGRIRTTADLRFSQPLSLPEGSMEVPATLVREPLLSFTAMKGADTWLKRLPLFADLGISEWPSQLFLWSLSGFPWNQYFAAPHPQPTNLITASIPALPLRIISNTVWQGTTFGLRITNQATRVELLGLQFFYPFLQATSVNDQSLLFGGLFLPNTRTPAAPEELLQQVNARPDLVLYDWEVTGRPFVTTNTPPRGFPRLVTNGVGRLVQFKELAQFGRMLHFRPGDLGREIARQGDRNAIAKGAVLVPGGRWVDAAAPLLGDTITEVTRVAPDHLKLARFSQLGVGSLELMYLLRWIENPGFPGWTPPPPPPASTNASPSPTPALPAVPALPTLTPPSPPTLTPVTPIPTPAPQPLAPTPPAPTPEPQPTPKVEPQPEPKPASEPASPTDAPGPVEPPPAPGDQAASAPSLNP